MPSMMQSATDIKPNIPLQTPAALYAPTEEYHTYVPGYRQKLLVPPATLGDRETDNLIIEPPKDHEFEVGEFAPQGFFNQVDRLWFFHKASRDEWTYAMRREAQEILPFLYLGPASVARDKEFVKNNGITLLFSIRDKRSATARLLSGTKVAEELGIQSDSIDVDNDQELIALYPQSIRRINQHVMSGASAQPGMPPKVLVFCESGNGRSASVVIAYIMSMLSMSMAAAMWTVHHRRFCIDVDESMQVLLQSFQSILDAKREVLKARRQESQGFLAVQPPPCSQEQGQLTRKRSFIDYDDEDHDIELTDGHTNDYGESAQQNMIDINGDPGHQRQKPAPFVERAP